MVIKGCRSANQAFSKSYYIPMGIYLEGQDNRKNIDVQEKVKK